MYRMFALFGFASSIGVVSLAMADEKLLMSDHELMVSIAGDSMDVDWSEWTDLATMPDEIPQQKLQNHGKKPVDKTTGDNSIGSNRKTNIDTYQTESGEGGETGDDESVTQMTLVPDYVRPLFNSLESGKNDSNPRWAPGGVLLSFERAEEGKQAIVIASKDGEILKNIYYKAEDTSKSDFGLDFLMPEIAQSENSYNANLTWSPDGNNFIFMSNAGEGNYDIYLDGINSNSTVRLTTEKQRDAQPSWAPNNNQVAFVSGRSGGALIYLLDLQTQHLKKITQGRDSFLYPRWSPDGKRIIAIYGTNENHNILVIENIDKTTSTSRYISQWTYDDLSPTWSPDGTKVAFYSNYNEQSDPKLWSIVVVDVNAPLKNDLSEYVVAKNVIPDVASGPAWLPDGKHIVYVRNDEHDYSPIYIADILQRKSKKLQTGTNINHDVSCSKQGVIAFRAQVNQWDQIYLTKITDIKI